MLCQKCRVREWGESRRVSRREKEQSEREAGGEAEVWSRAWKAV